ncbi:MAG: hypothetical protein II970_03415 [Paludibacteraceae bacterium]|nr:hypothetical protein [Paludibacteraceae bacterium]
MKHFLHHLFGSTSSPPPLRLHLLAAPLRHHLFATTSSAALLRHHLFATTSSPPPLRLHLFSTTSPAALLRHHIFGTTSPPARPRMPDCTNDIAHLRYSPAANYGKKTAKGRQQYGNKCRDFPDITPISP